MASLLDISLIGYFSDIFVILFVFTLVYAVLMFRKPLGPNKGLNALIAFGAAMIMGFSSLSGFNALAVVRDSVPWAILLTIILTMVVLASESFATPLPATLTKNLPVYILVIMVIVLVINVSLQLGQDVGPYLDGNISDPDNVVANGDGDVASGSFAQNFGATIFHPKVLALMLLLIIALFSVLLVGYW